MRNKILLPILAILSIVFIASFFFFSPIYLTSNGENKHFEDRDMSFDLTKEWTVYEYDDVLKTPFLSSSPDKLLLNPVSKSQYTNYQGNLSDLEDEVINTGTTSDFDVAIVKTEITKYNSLPEGVTFDDAYKADSLYSLMSSTGGFNLVEDQLLDINGKKAHRFNYVVSQVTYQDTWVENNGHYVRLLSQAPTNFFDDAKSQFDYLENSLVLK